MPRKLLGNVAIGALCALAFAAPSHAQGDRDPGTVAREQRTALSRECDAAWRANDHNALAAALDAAWSQDPAWARDRAFRVIQRGNGPQRAVGVQALTRHADAKSLGQAAAALSPGRFPDERRLLVRAMGPGLEDLSHVKRFIDDEDPLTRAAAVQALADAGQRAGVGFFIGRLKDAPAAQGKWDGDEDGILTMSQHGALYSLTGYRAEDGPSAQRWWESAGRRDAEAPPAGRERQRRGEAYYPTPSFDVQFKVQGIDGTPKSGPLAWGELSTLLEEAKAQALAAAEPIFGRMHLPPIRLLICDDTQFSAYAGLSFMGGVAMGNEIVMRLNEPRFMRGTLAHEYVHIIHGACYQEQPRWLGEGVAVSLSRSLTGSPWSWDFVSRAGLDEAVREGAFREAVNWTAGAASDEREGRMYELAYLVTDYLRFGGHAAPGAQLAMLMGKLSRSASATDALEEVYAMRIEALDAAVRHWLDQSR